MINILTLARHLSYAAFLVAVCCLTIDSRAETHQVLSKDFYYDPAQLTINEGDTVVWIWEGDNHDVVAGVSPNEAYPEVFDSGLFNEGHTFQLQFDRNFLNQHQWPDNIYPYHCTPHWFHMVGEIEVIRSQKPFEAELVGWQEVPDTQSDNTADCTVILSPEETEIVINCTHNVSNITGAAIRNATFGNTGPEICTMNPAELTAGHTCSFNPTQAEELWQGRLYVTVYSTDHPEGEIRGQIVHSGGSSKISGSVVFEDQPLPNVSVSNGISSTKTNSLGNYELQEVPNGVYILSATLEGYTIVADQNTNPVLVNNQDQPLRSFTASGDCFLDRCGVCNGNGMSCLGCEEFDISESIDDILHQFRMLRNLQRRSLRNLNSTQPQANMQKRLKRIRGLHSSVRADITAEFPEALVRLNCSNKEFCFEADIGETLNDYALRAHRQRRQITRLSRRAIRNTNKTFGLRRPIRRANTTFQNIQESLSHIPTEVNKCPL